MGSRLSQKQEGKGKKEKRNETNLKVAGQDSACSYRTRIKSGTTYNDVLLNVSLFPN